MERDFKCYSKNIRGPLWVNQVIFYAVVLLLPALYVNKCGGLEWYLYCM
jgi:hypothetical protein